MAAGHVWVTVVSREIGDVSWRRHWFEQRLDFQLEKGGGLHHQL